MKYKFRRECKIWQTVTGATASPAKIPSLTIRPTAPRRTMTRAKRVERSNLQSPGVVVSNVSSVKAWISQGTSIVESLH